MKLKSVFFSACLLLSMCVAAQSNKSDCQKFRVGTFQYLNDSSELVIVERTKKYQVERNQKTNQVDKCRIKWVDDCTYEIRPFWSSNKTTRKKKSGPTQVKIIKVLEDRYEYTCACKTLENAEAYKGTMIKVK